MKKDKDLDVYTFVGIFLFVIVTLIDKFFIPIDNSFYIPAMLIALVVIIMGFVEKKEPETK